MRTYVHLRSRGSQRSTDPRWSPQCFSWSCACTITPSNFTFGFSTVEPILCSRPNMLYSNLGCRWSVFRPRILIDCFKTQLGMMSNLHQNKTVMSQRETPGVGRIRQPPANFSVQLKRGVVVRIPCCAVFAVMTGVAVVNPQARSTSHQHTWTWCDKVWFMNTSNFPPSHLDMTGRKYHKELDNEFCKVMM